MNSSGTPTRIPLPFASSGLKNTIPEIGPGTNPNNASFDVGFPPVTMEPVASGGLPPYGQDLNGILYSLTQIARWANAGGSYVYNSTFASDANVGGYPKGSVLLKSGLAGFWFNTTEGNTSNPDTGGAGWVDFSTILTSLPIQPSIAGLRTQLKTGPAYCLVYGYYAHGDGGGGTYYYDSTDVTSPDNGGTIIVASDGGRWKLQYTGPLSAKQFGAKEDGVTDDTAALATMVARGQPFIMLGESAFQNGDIGPAFGTINRVDYATIGTNEKLTNGGFTGSATGWALTNFTYAANAISHVAGSVGQATQSITLKDYRLYKLTVTLTTTTSGGVDFQFNGVTMLDDTGFYMLDPSTNTFSFPFLSSAAATANFAVVTDLVWAGSIDTLSVIEITEEMPLSNLFVPTDDSALRIPYGFKFGRYNAGVTSIGDRQTTAFASINATWNVANGARALEGNIDGFENTAMGAFAARYTLTSRGTYYGYAAGKYNTLGVDVTFLGYKAGTANTTGSRNDAYGKHSLFQNRSGNDNLGAGYQALYNLLTTSGNTSIGSQSALNCRGTENTYFGALAGLLNASAATTYTYNFGISIGAETKVYGDNGTAVGFQAQVGVDGTPINNAISLGATVTNKIANSAKIGNGITKLATAGRLYSGEASNSDGTAAGITMTAAQFASQAFTRSGPSGAFSDTTPTAAAIVAAIPGAEAGIGYEIWIRNTTAFLLTMLAGAGVTLGGTTTVGATQSRLYKVFITNAGAGTEAVTVVGICTAAN